MRRSVTASSLMATLMATVCIALTAGTASAASTAHWSRGTEMLAARGWFGTAVVNNLMYAVGGDGRGSTEAYKPSTRTWHYRAALPDTRDWFAVAAQGGEVYAFGGFVAGPNSHHSSRESDRYDPASDTWIRVAAMPTDRYGAAAVTGQDGRIYVIGGWSTRSNTALTTLEAYSPLTNSWKVLASMHAARQSPGAAMDRSGRIYAIGGYNTTRGYLRSVERYNPATNAWVTVRSMREARAGLSAVTGEDGRIYAMGGYNPRFARRFRRTVEVYGAFGNVWRPAPAMPVARANFAAARIGPKIYALGGENQFTTRLRAVSTLHPVLPA
jgi:N-acetylneuraminic acid mutarotase